MMTICGHEREQLRIGLEMFELWGDDPLPNTDDNSHPYAAAVRDGNDPAKLAEMLAEEGWRLGFAKRDAEIVDIDASLPIPMYVLAEHGHVAIYTLEPQSPRWSRYVLTMPQARALLLKWLQLPDGAREETERVLRGEL